MLITVDKLKKWKTINIVTKISSYQDIVINPVDTVDNFVDKMLLGCDLV